jgi:hypothetical protein
MRHLGEVRMPELDHGMDLLGWLFEIGPLVKGKELDAADLVNWQQLLGIEWRPRESRLLIRLSREYLGAMYAARDPQMTPPWPGAARAWAVVQGANAVQEKNQAIAENEEK